MSKTRQSQTVQSLWIEQLQQNQENSILARTLWQDGRNLYQRFQNSYQRLLALPRKWRRAIQRKIAPSLAAAALALALGTFSIRAVPMAAINVDGVTCTLADAITAANTDTAVNGCAAGNGDDEINLQIDVTLSADLPPIYSNIILNGNDHTIDGVDTYRALNVTSPINLTINDTTITGGFTTEDGGGLKNNDGTVVINDSTISGNSAGVNGGGISSYQGSMTLNRTIVSGNTAATFGGGIFASNLPEAGLVINSSIISGNDVGRWGGGIHVKESVLEINDSEISENTAYEYGGGLAIENSEFTISQSTIQGNEVYQGGGGLEAQYSTGEINDSTISGNTAHGFLIDPGGNSYYASGYGGGLDLEFSSATINKSTISGNSAVSGGGLLFYGYYYSYGYGRYDELIINQSTISGNNAINIGGGIDTLISGLHLDINQSTIINNSAAEGGGIRLDGDFLELDNSIVSGNTADTGSEIFSTSDAYGYITSGNNIIGHGGSAGSYNFTPNATDYVPTGLLVTIISPALADNGGPTLTHDLPANSPAIDFLTADGNTPDTDQRGWFRNIGDGVDAGAIERQFRVFLPMIVKDITE